MAWNENVPDRIFHITVSLCAVASLISSKCYVLQQEQNLILHHLLTKGFDPPMTNTEKPFFCGPEFLLYISRTSVHLLSVRLLVTGITHTLRIVEKETGCSLVVDHDEYKQTQPFWSFTCNIGRRYGECSISATELDPRFMHEAVLSALRTFKRSLCR